MGNGAALRRQCSRPSSTLHPFIERLIGMIRREYLDHILFWTTADLEAKLIDFERMRGWKGACRNRLQEELRHQLVSVRTGGEGTVEACTKLR